MHFKIVNFANVPNFWGLVVKQVYISGKSPGKNSMNVQFEAMLLDTRNPRAEGYVLLVQKVAVVACLLENTILFYGGKNPTLVKL